MDKLPTKNQSTLTLHDARRPGDTPDLYIEAMDHRDGPAYYGRALFNTDGFDWLRIGLANEDADTIQRGVDMVYDMDFTRCDGKGPGYPGLGARILADYHAWKAERVKEGKAVGEIAAGLHVPRDPC